VGAREPGEGAGARDYGLRGIAKGEGGIRWAHACARSLVEPRPERISPGTRHTLFTASGARSGGTGHGHRDGPSLRNRGGQLRLRSSTRRERMRRFALDDDSLGDRKAVFIAAQCVGVDEEGKVPV
jgi:hypothetical protein